MSHETCYIADMIFGKLARFCVVMATLMMSISSCAYMQTHKQIESQAEICRGFCVEKPSIVYSHGGNWYLKVRPVALRKEYPLVYDSIMLTENNAPVLREIPNSEASSAMYVSLSSGTAKVLMRADGYAMLSTLRDELSEGQIITTSAGMRPHNIAATIDTKGVKSPGAYCIKSTQNSAGMGNKVLRNTSLILVDAPGTLLYNVAIPVMAPFIFFNDFFSEKSTFESIND